MEELPEPRELDSHTFDGQTRRLLWLPDTEIVYVEIDDHKERATHTVIPKPDKALDAFNHPFRYNYTSVKWEAGDE